MVYLQLFLLDESLNTLYLETRDVKKIHDVIGETCGVSVDKYFLLSEGKLVLKETDVGSNVQAVPRLRGGKGGFGSMLRAIGAQIEKTTNREACRDLSGRRLRDINEEQRLKKWISEKSKRQQEQEEIKKKKLEKLSREPKHEFKDEKYEAERTDLTEKLSDSVAQGLQASSGAGPSKRKLPQGAASKKKKKTILDDDFSSSGEESGDDSTSSSSPSTIEHSKTQQVQV